MHRRGIHVRIRLVNRLYKLTVRVRPRVCELVYVCVCMCVCICVCMCVCVRMRDNNRVREDISDYVCST